jgi:flotillin
MGEASIVEMIMNALPQVAKEVSAPLSSIDNITMYGDQSTKLIEGGTQKIDKIFKIAEDSLGLDLKSLITGFATSKLLDNNSNNDNK